MTYTIKGCNENIVKNLWEKNYLFQNTSCYQKFISKRNRNIHLFINLYSTNQPNIYLVLSY